MLKYQGNSPRLNVDIEDLEEVLKKLETSFNVKFESNELKDVVTFGELCSIILEKMNLTNVSDCTSQQVFYKLRFAVAKTMNIKAKTVLPSSSMNSLFPHFRRISNIRKVESILGFDLSIYQTHILVQVLFLILFFGSLALFMISWNYAIIGLLFTLFFKIFANRIFIDFKFKTIKDVIEKLKSDHYVKSRRNPLTANKQEVIESIEKIFLAELAIDLKEIPLETIIR